MEKKICFFLFTVLTIVVLMSYSTFKQGHKHSVKQVKGQLEFKISPAQAQTTVISQPSNKVQNKTSSLSEGWYLVLIEMQGYDSWQTLVRIGKTQKITIRKVLQKKRDFDKTFARGALLTEVENQLPFLKEVNPKYAGEHISVFSNNRVEKFQHYPIMNDASTATFIKGSWKKNGSELVLQASLQYKLDRSLGDVTAFLMGKGPVTAEFFPWSKISRDSMGGEMLWDANKSGTWGEPKKIVSPCLVEKSWLIVPWENRTYLLQKIDIQQFIRAIIRGAEPRKSKHGSFFMHCNKPEILPTGIPFLSTVVEKQLIRELIKQEKRKNWRLGESSWF